MDKKTILLIDDNPSNLTLLDNLLRHDYRVKVAIGGAKGLKLALAEDTPDLILLDILMPEMDGFAVCEVLQMNRKTHHIPVMFLTTLNQAEAAERGLALGAVDFISKPIGAHDLIHKIACHFVAVDGREKALNMV
jgi:putative two-component system response regulator